MAPTHIAPVNLYGFGCGAEGILNSSGVTYLQICTWMARKRSGRGEISDRIPPSLALLVLQPGLTSDRMSGSLPTWKAEDRRNGRSVGIG